MLQRIVSRRYVFTVSGNWGDLTVFNASGTPVAKAGTPAEAEAWCEAKTRSFPEKATMAPRDVPGVGRSQITGY